MPSSGELQLWVVNTRLGIVGLAAGILKFSVAFFLYFPAAR